MLGYVEMLIVVSLGFVMSRVYKENVYVWEMCHLMGVYMVVWTLRQLEGQLFCVFWVVSVYNCFVCVIYVGMEASVSRGV